MDCANGVGAAKLQVLADRLAPGLSAELRNTGAEGLNDGCGADFLQKERRLPAGFQDVPEGARCAAPSVLPYSLPQKTSVAASLCTSLHICPDSVWPD